MFSPLLAACNEHAHREKGQHLNVPRDVVLPVQLAREAIVCYVGGREVHTFTILAGLGGREEEEEGGGGSNYILIASLGTWSTDPIVE